MTEPPPRSRGTVFLQVLVAAIFLAVIGGSVGLTVGLYERNRDSARGSATGGGSQGGGSPTQDASEGTSTPCQSSSQLEENTGQYDLAQVLYIQTEKSEVWICRTAGGTLYYGGHRFSDDTRLFLTRVEQRGEEFVATNPTAKGATVYRVSRQRLVIESAGSEPEEQQVINWVG